MKKETVKKSTASKKEEVVKKELQQEEIKETPMPLTPAEEAAVNLKKTYKEVFITNVADIQIVWRKIKRSEYKKAMSIKFDDNEDINFFERQEYMARKVILFPENIDELLEDYAGVSDIIATETMVKTGFGITSTKKA